MKDYTKIYQLKGLKPKNKGHTNSYECCDLTKKLVYLLMDHLDQCNGLSVLYKCANLMTSVPFLTHLDTVSSYTHSQDLVPNQTCATQELNIAYFIKLPVIVLTRITFKKSQICIQS